jgi:Putative Mg2+ and Co2+ transporter CorC
MTKDRPGYGVLTRLKSLATVFTRKPEDRSALIDILRDSERRNLVDPDALAMIEGALQMSDMQARDIMIPRVQMKVVKHDSEPDEILSIVIESGHSRFPVTGNDVDEVLGILLAKDLLFILPAGIRINSISKT